MAPRRSTPRPTAQRPARRAGKAARPKTAPPPAPVNAARPAARAEAKRAAILTAAFALFLRHGFRRTTLDEIAAAAAVAKPTVYAYFADKDALYVAVVKSVLDSVLLAAEEALGKEPLAERLVAILSAKFTRVFMLLESSPHAAELMDANGTLAGCVIAKADEAFVALLEREVKRAVGRGELALGRLGLSARDLAQVLLQVGHGAEIGARDEASHRRNLARLVGVVLAAARQR